ncbi:MAG: hypothetical protein GY906_32430 [bacterium]|nr:hypothetical protein [bacterium]
MIANPLKRQRAIRGARIAAVVLLLLMPLVWLTSHRRTLKQVRFDGDKVRETRMMRHQAIAGSPAGLFSQEVECQQELIDHYIGLYIRRHGRPEQIAKARICLEILADAKVVEPALGLLRVSEEETADSAGSDSSQDLDYVDDIISLLVNIGDAGTYELERGLRDRDPMLSLVSARVLALRSSPLAVETLLLHTEDPIDGVRIAVTTRLREIISSGHLTRYESMELLENLAKDENSMVRRNVVRSLRVLAGRRPRELATVLSLDSDPRVSQSARYLLDAGNPQL